jgi:hypothetical protein
MRRLTSLFATLLFVTGLQFLSSCKKENKDSFDAEAQKSYNAVMDLQEQSVAIFNGFLATQDTLTARESLKAWFESSADVDWAVVSCQGVTVSYKNGIHGGFVDDFLRRNTYESSGNSREFLQPDSRENLKGLPTNKKAIILAAFYDSWPETVDPEKAAWQTGLETDGFSPVEEIRNNQVTLDKFADIEGYGIIDFNTHGMLWPSEFNTQDVLLMTHELKNDKSTKKYWDDIKAGKIGIFTTGDFETIYGVVPDFISEYNDFSKDTVMFWGGFCFSYLGHWPELVNGCAAGTYLGVDWTFNSYWAEKWASALITSLSDHSLSNPVNVEEWMTGTELPKNYFDKSANKTVTLNYLGYGGLTLWKPENEGNGTIVSTDPGGVPITAEGFTCTDYVLQCLPDGQLPEHMGYEWDYGDGSSTYYTVDDNLALFHHWSNPQSYHVKVTITERYSGSFVMELNTTVSFVYPDFLPVLKANAVFEAHFGPYQAFNFTGTVTGFPGFDFNTADYDVPLTWTDSSFTSQDIQNNDYETITVEGNVSSDGSILRHCLLKKISQDQPDHELVLEITNLPILTLDQVNCLTSFYVDNTGTGNQAYLTLVEYKEYEPVSQTWITISSIDWATTQLYLNFLMPDPRL